MESLALAKRLTALVIYQIGTVDQSGRGNSTASYLWAGGSCLLKLLEIAKPSSLENIGGEDW